MGPPKEFADFQTRLKTAGLDYPDAEYVSGPDPERHVALLSKYPIVSHQSLTMCPLRWTGARRRFRRGILDVTIAVGNSKVRFIGVHLKSKLRDTWENEAGAAPE